MINLLVQQLANEMGNFYFYKKIQNHYEALNYKGFAKYFKDAADEEKEHFEKILDYLYKKQEVFEIPFPVSRELPKELSDISIAEARLNLERGTSQEWYNIYDSARGEGLVTFKNGKNVVSNKCNPSVIETIAAEFIAIQDAEEEEAYNYLAKIKMSTNILILDNELYNG